MIGNRHRLMSTIIEDFYMANAKIYNEEKKDIILRRRGYYENIGTTGNIRKDCNIYSCIRKFLPPIPTAKAPYFKSDRLSMQKIYKCM